MNNRVILVRDSLELLRQVRAGIADESSHSLRGLIDEVIVKLEVYVSRGEEDPGRVRAALKVLAQGLALIPELQQIIDLISRR